MFETWGCVQFHKVWWIHYVSLQELFFLHEELTAVHKYIYIFLNQLMTCVHLRQFLNVKSVCGRSECIPHSTAQLTAMEQLWSPAVAHRQRSRSADQLSPKWQATAESIHLEAPGTPVLHTSLNDFFSAAEKRGSSACARRESVFGCCLNAQSSSAGHERNYCDG